MDVVENCVLDKALVLTEPLRIHERIGAGRCGDVFSGMYSEIKVTIFTGSVEHDFSNIFLIVFFVLVIKYKGCCANGPYIFVL